MAPPGPDPWLLCGATQTPKGPFGPGNLSLPPLVGGHLQNITPQWRQWGQNGASMYC